MHSCTSWPCTFRNEMQQKKQVLHPSVPSPLHCSGLQGAELSEDISFIPILESLPCAITPLTCPCCTGQIQILLEGKTQGHMAREGVWGRVEGAICWQWWAMQGCSRAAHRGNLGLPCAAPAARLTQMPGKSKWYWLGPCRGHMFWLWCSKR